MCLATAIALLAASVPAAAAPKRIAGKLDKPGYTVVALNAGGKAATDRAGQGRFELRPPGQLVTLHLLAKDGTYAGPVVVGSERRGRRAILGVRAGTPLGKVDVRKPRGYATVARKLPKRAISAKRRARAKKNAPIGAGNFGRVLSKRTRGGLPGDLDFDGIPDPLDIDDDGDLILDEVEGRQPVQAASATADETASSEFRIASNLAAPAEVTANVNVGSSNEEIEGVLPEWGLLHVQIRPGDSSELDCGGSPDPANPAGWIGGLSYCTNGGSGEAARPGDPPAPFPGCCDADGDGYGTLFFVAGSGGLDQHFFLDHGATTPQIGSGDVLVQHVATGVPESECPPPEGATNPSCASFVSTLPFVFATTPALVSYRDTAGHEGTVRYPIGGPGGSANEFPVGPDPESGDVILRLTFYLPQRRPIPGELCPPPDGRLCDPSTDWIDIGGLRIGAGIADFHDTGAGAGQCPSSAFSEDDPATAAVEDDPELEMTPEGFAHVGPDRPASQKTTISYTLNLSSCFMGPVWEPGKRVGVTFSADANNAGTEQGGVRFKLE